jgi:hypothetical protein
MTSRASDPLHKDRSDLMGMFMPNSKPMVSLTDIHRHMEHLDMEHQDMEHQDMEPSMISIVHNTEEEDMEQI